MTKEERLRQTLPFWGELEERQRRALLAAAAPRSFRAGESLHAGSGDCTGLLIVESGRLRAYLVSEGGREITLYRLFELDICLFSASCMMRDIRFEIFIEAEKDTRVLVLPAAVYHALMEESAAVAGFTNRLMSSRFSDVMWVMEQVLFTSFDRRLADFLLEQRTIEGADRLALTQETIARHLGTAREVVTRMLRYFQSEGMVRLFRGGVEILSPDRLTDCALRNECREAGRGKP